MQARGGCSAPCPTVGHHENSGTEFDLEHRAAQWSHRRHEFLRLTPAGDGTGTSGTRENGTITLFDSTHAQVASFEFTNGWPARYRVVQEESGVVIEEITLAVDDLQRVN